MSKFFTNDNAVTAFVAGGKFIAPMIVAQLWVMGLRPSVEIATFIALILVIWGFAASRIFTSFMMKDRPKHLNRFANLSLWMITSAALIALPYLLVYRLDNREWALLLAVLACFASHLVGVFEQFARKDPPDDGVVRPHWIVRKIMRRNHENIAN